MIPFEWVSRRGERALADWRLDSRQRRQLTQLLVDLEKYDYEMALDSIIYKKGAATKKGAADLYYSKINGNVALRPRCCVGPEMTEEEFKLVVRARKALGLSEPHWRARLPEGKSEIVTYLERVTKKDKIENPLMKDSRSGERLQEIKEDRNRRRAVVFHAQN